MRTSRPASAASRLAQGGSDHLFDRLPLLAHDDRPRLEPRHVEQVRDEPVESLGLLADRLEQLAAARVGQRAPGAEERARRSPDRGQGRAQVVRDGREQRASHPLGLGLKLGGLRLRGQVGALHRQRDLTRKRLEKVHALGVERLAAPQGADPEHAHGAVRDEQGQVESGAARQRRGAQARALGVVEHPLRDGGFLRIAGERSALRERRGEPPVPMREEDRHAALEHLGEALAGDPDHVVGLSRAGARAAHGVQRGRPALARTRRFALVAHPGRQVRDHERHCEHHAQREEVLRVGDGEAEAGRDEEEVERQHAQHRGEHGRPPPPARRHHDEPEEVHHDEVGEREVPGEDARDDGARRHDERRVPELALPSRRDGHRPRARDVVLAAARDHVDVDLAAPPDDALDERAVNERPPARLGRLADDELGHVAPTGVGEHLLGDVRPRERGRLAAQLLRELHRPFELLAIRVRHPGVTGVSTYTAIHSA